MQGRDGVWGSRCRVALGGTAGGGEAWYGFGHFEPKGLMQSKSPLLRQMQSNMAVRQMSPRTIDACGTR